MVHHVQGRLGVYDIRSILLARSLAEAQAYCRFRGFGARVISEPEYERLLSPDVHSRCVMLPIRRSFTNRRAASR